MIILNFLISTALCGLNVALLSLINGVHSGFFVASNVILLLLGLVICLSLAYRLVAIGKDQAQYPHSFLAPSHKGLSMCVSGVGEWRSTYCPTGNHHLTCAHHLLNPSNLPRTHYSAAFAADRSSTPHRHKGWKQLHLQWGGQL